MSKASFVSQLVWELRLAKNFPIDLTDPVNAYNQNAYSQNATAGELLTRAVAF